MICSYDIQRINKKVKIVGLIECVDVVNARFEVTCIYNKMTVAGFPPQWLSVYDNVQ